ncbi:MAG: hypothetical protein ABIW38_07975 [Ferruginibacter sp.]
MKKIWYFLILSTVSFNALAQEKTDENEDKPKGFQKDKLFTGGSLNLSFGNRTTALGISPYFGYSLNKYIDVAASVGVNYTSQRDPTGYGVGDKIRQTIIGPGALLRIFPVHFLFAQAQYEHNFIKYKYLSSPNSSYADYTANIEANSLLVGGGYSQGRRDGTMFYYLSVLWDVANNANSPYVDELNRALPIFRAGIQIGLFQGKSKR